MRHLNVMMEGHFRSKYKRKAASQIKTNRIVEETSQYQQAHGSDKTRRTYAAASETYSCDWGTR